MNIVLLIVVADNAIYIYVLITAILYTITPVIYAQEAEVGRKKFPRHSLLG